MCTNERCTKLYAPPRETSCIGDADLCETAVRLFRQRGTNTPGHYFRLHFLFLLPCCVLQLCFEVSAVAISCFNMLLYCFVVISVKTLSAVFFVIDYIRNFKFCDCTHSNRSVLNEFTAVSTKAVLIVLICACLLHISF